MTAKEKRKQYIDKHPLGHLTIAQLRAKGKKEGVLAYGSKSKMLQCFDQSKQMTKLFKINRPLIIDFLKNEPGARLTYYRHWMVWDKDDQCWKVYKEGSKGIGKVLIETTNEELAIAKLIYN